MKKNPNKKELKYIYMIEVDNHNNKSKFYGLSKIYYTGQTNNLKLRFLQHLHKINNQFLKKNFPDATKKLVFVKYLWGDEYEAIGEETRIKSMSRKQKEKLINSSENILISYKPLKVIVLKKFKCLEEEILIRL